MRLLLDPAQRLLVATANIAIESLLVLDIYKRCTAAQRRTRLLENMLVERRFLLVKRAVDAVNLVAQQHISIRSLFNPLQPFVIGLAKRREGRHELVESLGYVAVIVAKRLRFHALGFERDGLVFFHLGPVVSLFQIVLAASRIRCARPLSPDDRRASRPCP